MLRDAETKAAPNAATYMSGPNRYRAVRCAIISAVHGISSQRKLWLWLHRQSRFFSFARGSGRARFRGRRHGVLGKQRCRKRHDRDAHQQQAVPEQDGLVGDPHEREDPVVIHPHHQNHGEAHQVGDIGLPLAGQFREQRPFGSVRAEVRHLDIEDQQRDGDREDTVAEGIDAAGLLFLARRPFAVPGGHRAKQGNCPDRGASAFSTRRRNSLIGSGLSSTCRCSPTSLCSQTPQSFFTTTSAADC